MEVTEKSDKPSTEKALSLFSVLILLNLVGLWVVVLSHGHNQVYAKVEHVHDYADRQHSHKSDSWFDRHDHDLDYSRTWHSH